MMGFLKDIKRAFKRAFKREVLNGHGVGVVMEECKSEMLKLK